MSQAKSVLEHRIRLIAATRSNAHGRLALATLFAAALVFVGIASVPLPRPPSWVGVGAFLRSDRTATSAAQYGTPLPEGTLPGDPGEERRAAEIEAHHAAAVAKGLPAGSIIWFVEDRRGRVRRTGIAGGTEQAVTARLRALYPTETSDFAMAWSDVPAGAGTATVVWLLPPR